MMKYLVHSIPSLILVGLLLIGLAFTFAIDEDQSYRDFYGTFCHDVADC